MVYSKYGKYDNSRELQDNAVLWRYMTLSKFLDMITTQTLYFSRLDKFDDFLEGELGNINYNNLLKIGYRRKKYIDDEKFKPDLLNKEKIFINCWYNDSIESNALWKLFTNTEEGIAIRTFLRNIRLIDKNIISKRVKYLNIQEEHIYFNTINEPYFYKEKFFEYEKEVRFVIDTSLCNINDKEIIKYDEKNDEIFGLRVNIKLNKIIEEVKFSPFMHQYQKDLIKHICEKYEYDLEFSDSLYKKHF